MFLMYGKCILQELYKAYTQHEKKYGDKGGIEDVIVSKRKFQYEEVRVAWEGAILNVWSVEVLMNIVMECLTLIIVTIIWACAVLRHAT